MPVITSLSDDALIAAQHVGRSLGAPDCRIEVLRTSDGGTELDERKRCSLRCAP